jgi:uncharacterized protein (TIGR01777 family)
MSKVEVYERSITLPHSVEESWVWHERQFCGGRFGSLPLNIEYLDCTGTIRDGDRLTFRMRVGPLSIPVTLEHEGYDPPREYGNRQIVGPHRSQRHRHIFRAIGESQCELTDRVECVPSRIAALLGRENLRRKVEQALEATHEMIRRDLARLSPGPGKPLRVLMTGASGSIGATLVPFLESGGHEVCRLVRRTPAPPAEIAWDPAAGKLEAAALEGFDAVIHLAGENIGAGRWTEARRGRIWQSRVQATELLCGALAGLRQPPAVLVAASAVGYYGDTADLVDESAPVGNGFLAELTDAWEHAAAPAREAGIRVAHARLGAVLSPRGGLLKRLLPLFRLGAGGVVGSGRQPISWIGMDDAIGALYFLMISEEACGPINVVAPKPAANREITRTLAAVLRRPAFARVPSIAIRALFGEMGEQLILKGQAAAPARLNELGFRWEEPTLEDALRWELGKPAN